MPTADRARTRLPAQRGEAWTRCVSLRNREAEQQQPTCS
jgi:hypothetical protein